MSLKKITASRAHEIIAQNRCWTMLVDGAPPDPDNILNLSLAYGLSGYDAAYLDLAIRLHIPIATKDEALQNAAKAAGGGVVSVRS